MNVALPLAYQDLEPAPVWGAFALLNSTPRPSGQEERLRRVIEQLAQEKGASARSDERGNLCVVLPGRNSSPGAPTVALQAHLDMVCQKRPEVAFNFESDAISPRRDGDKISATGTTLGADNGIGVAYMLALLDGVDSAHPPLELLFTVEEETGLYGAALLDPALVSARRLINLDSEEDDEITIGCAGGAGVALFLPIEREARHENESAYRFTVGGLAGGHSGIQIGEPLGNALKIAGQILDALRESVPALRLSSFDGGTAHNAIPRDCHVAFATPAAQDGALSTAWAHISTAIETKWQDNEPNLVLSLEEAGAVEAPLSAASTETVLGLVRALPHGVQKMSERWAGKVQTSSNMAEIKTEEGEVAFHISNRSFLACDIADMQEHCATLGKNAGARVEMRDGYPGWEPRAHSPLRDQTAAAFANVSGKIPRIEVVHAGLECGLLSEKLPGLDAVSFGPTIRGAHTPEEWVSIASVGRNWAILQELLAALAL
ncbi:cytosol non-specific dipeptidase [Abditibacteriota bacterium]|nr:cytosol non-specific dipeptidase [Abditibacteriota bacterium]